MSASGNYENTYWCHRGNYEALLAKLQPLVPAQDSVDNPDANPALERFRLASNCYYDLYNNGLGNRGREFLDVFGFAAHRPEFDESDGDRFDRALDDAEFDQALIDRVEYAMDGIILAAANEQGLIEPRPRAEGFLAERIGVIVGEAARTNLWSPAQVAAKLRAELSNVHLDEVFDIGYRAGRDGQPAGAPNVITPPSVPAEDTYRKALEQISSLWPEPPNCAPVGPDAVSGVNDGRMRAIALEAALKIARRALGKTCGV